MLALISLSAFADSTQSRKLYVSDSNNSCNQQSAGSNLGDHVKLIITTLDNNQVIEVPNVSSSTSCDNWKSKYIDKIISNQAFSYVSSDHKTIIEIMEDIKKIKTDAIITAYEIDNPALINNKDYNCVINGNGTTPLYNTGEINIKCELVR